ncbi:histidine kinase N-terminal 7TM domain-containing protein [Halomicroarcula sp. GCM10025324]|uniref:histidine kinase N-terminal 7TM domain-containing protein n=1 Tax=Haloarcula TaxID=2237 RepID=UPI0023E798D5|nr:histidine kinase N-terminal 7TM domain-containing protein [Halomicroarcula sp. ZS-22-S1]
MKIVLVGTIAVGVTGGLLAWRERPEPGSVPLVLLLAGQCWWSTTLFFRITSTSLSAKVFWVDVSWVGIGLIPVAWLYFALEYAGYDEYTTRKYLLALSVVPAITAILGLTSEFHHLLYVDTQLVAHGAVTSISRSPGIWFWVIAIYTYLLGLLGALPLLGLVTSEVSTFRGQSLALLVGIVAPWATNLLFLFGLLPTAGIDPTPVAFGVSGIAYLGALTRFQLFGANPTAIRHARDVVFRRMQQGALVLDSHDHIIDLNEQAAEALGLLPREALGRPVEYASPKLKTIGSSTRLGHNVYHPPNSNRAYDVSVSTVTDIHDRTIGRVITLHDISEHLRQQQRLEVLNRIFRHNIRTSTQVILGNAEYLATNNSEEKSAKLQQQALEIEDISQKARTIIDVFEQGRKQRKSLRLDAILGEAVASAEDAYPSVDVHYESGSADVYVDSLFDTVLQNVVENAAAHNIGPEQRVWISVETDGDHATVSVADDGPGIDENELRLIEEGSETPLGHGSGFGLALIAWGTDIAGGSVAFDDNDPTGSVVTVEAPILTGPETDSADTPDDG